VQRLGRVQVKSYASNLNGITGEAISLFNVRTKCEASGQVFDVPHYVILCDGHQPGVCEDAECLIIAEMSDVEAIPRTVEEKRQTEKE